MIESYIKNTYEINFIPYLVIPPEEAINKNKIMLNLSNEF